MLKATVWKDIVDEEARQKRMVVVRPGPGHVPAIHPAQDARRLLVALLQRQRRRRPWLGDSWGATGTRSVPGQHTRWRQ